MRTLKYECDDFINEVIIEKNNIKTKINKRWIEGRLQLLVCHKFTIMNYDDGSFISLTEGKILYARNFNLKEQLYMVTLNKDDCSGYLISEDEIKYYTIPIFDNKIKFNIVNVTKNLFGIKDKNILFSIDDIDVDYIFQYLNILYPIKTLLQLEDTFVIDKFISNILGILKDSMNMVNNEELSNNEKIMLISQTKDLILKLYQTITSIAPLDETKKVIISFQLLEQYAKEQEQEKKEIEEKQKEIELKKEEFKKDYLLTIKSKSSLIDDFNS